MAVLGDRFNFLRPVRTFSTPDVAHQGVKFPTSVGFFDVRTPEKGGE